MKIHLLNQKEEKLLQRKKVLFKVDFDKVTPKKEELKIQVSENLKTEPELVVIEKIDQGFGERSAEIHSLVYFDKNFMKKVEVRNKKIKKKQEAKQEDKK